MIPVNNITLNDLKRKSTFKYPLEKGHLFYPYPSCAEIADRDLLPSFHVVSVYPKKDLPFFIVFTAALFTVTAMLAVLTHQVNIILATLPFYPPIFAFRASYFYSFLVEKMDSV